jgi:3-hydroxymyristoyl/3-hydroxydecanoyl-(acyl carrier protein) dehydratase
MMEVTIPHDHASFPGHFPGNPILPGVLLLQRVMALAQSQYAEVSQNKIFQDFTLLNVKFLAVVSPGDTLSLKLVDSLTKNLAMNLANISTDSQLDMMCREKIFTVHILQNSAIDSVLACTGKLRLNDVCDAGQ